MYAWTQEEISTACLILTEGLRQIAGNLAKIVPNAQFLSLPLNRIFAPSRKNKNIMLSNLPKLIFVHWATKEVRGLRSERDSKSKCLELNPPSASAPYHCPSRIVACLSR